ncbi:MAG: zinc ribbon domain-containing protein [Dehalococcoidales bacterium]
MFAMFAKLKRFFFSALVGAIGIGVAGVLFAYLNGMDDGSTLLWILGWLLIGFIVNVTIGFVVSGNKLSKFVMWGIIAGVVAGFLSADPSYDLWMKMGIIGLTLGIGIGIAGVSYTPPADKKPAPKQKEEPKDPRNIPCDECGSLVAEDDNFCHECGTEFEE